MAYQMSPEEIERIEALEAVGEATWQIEMCRSEPVEPEPAEEEE